MNGIRRRLRGLTALIVLVALAAVAAVRRGHGQNLASRFSRLTFRA